MKNSAATFQHLMNKVLAGLTNCKAYIDDVIMYSNTWEEQTKHLRALFECFVQANLVVNLKKCEFAKATVTCLGHVVGEGRVLPRTSGQSASHPGFPKAVKQEGINEIPWHVWLLSKVLCKL